MLIGAMNHPAKDPVKEIHWMAELDLDFVDLTLEPPEAASWKVNARQIRNALEDHGIGVVGHTAYYLPIGSPFEDIRRAAVDELKRCLEVFANVGTKWMNIHPDRHTPMHGRSFIIEKNLQSLQDLLDFGRGSGVGLMVENVPSGFNNSLQLAQLLDPLPEVGLHLDLGHCNLMVEQNTAEDIIRQFGDRIRHVHLHDNKGGNADLHLPLGAGTMDVSRHVKMLRASGYDSTITLEVFSPDHRYLAYSRDILRKLWDDANDPLPAVSRQLMSA